MADLGFLGGFDASKVEPRKAFDVLPAGDYIAIISESEMKTTQAGTGEYLKLTYSIVEGQHAGRKLWENLNLRNPNAQAVEIARASFSAICRAVGVLTPNTSEQLHNIPILIKVGIKKNKENQEAENTIKGYLPKNAPGSNGSYQTPSPQTAGAASGGTAPWKQKAAS